MRTSRTATVLIITVALLIVWAIPAGAGKPAPELVNVTMKLAPGSTQGLTTDVACGGPIIMVRNQDGLGEGDEEPILGVHMDDVTWSRWYPDFVESDEDGGLYGCHGGMLNETTEMNTYMQISMDRKTGAVTDLVWHFDRYYDDEARVSFPNGKKTRDNGIVLENFSLIGRGLQNSFECGADAAESTVCGWFELSYYLRDDTGVHVGIEPENSRQWFEFTLKTEPLN